jgi:hypothetical protein
LRHFARVLLIITPLCLAYLAFMPSSLGIRLLTGLTFSGAGILFSLVNILVETDRRAVRAGHKSGLAEHIRGERSAERQRTASYDRRERIAARAAKRRRY